MVSVTSDYLFALIASFIFPLARILGVVALAPVFGNTAVPMRTKVLVGAALAVVIAPAVPAAPSIDPSSWHGMLLLVREILIGLVIGFAAKLVFSAVEMAGELIGTQIGLGFAIFFSPMFNSAALPTSRLFVTLAMLTFLALNGHLLVIGALAKSFYLVPIGQEIATSLNPSHVVKLGKDLFVIALSLALPVIGALLVTNIALGILARATPQLHLFALGFPIMLLIGLLVLNFGLPSLLVALGTLPETMSRAMLDVLSN
jgi:flagellar biosynthesis protein FliR